jgi:hypothetical protein
MFIRKLSGGHNLHTIGDQRNRNHNSRDYDVREFQGQDGSTISLLEEFDPMTGRIIHVFWQVDYDPANRTAMIYG